MGKATSKTATEIADYGSRIGFKGHEHLGSNLNAIWQVEQNTSIAGGDSGFANRESSSVWKVVSVKFVPVTWTLLWRQQWQLRPWESGANADALQLVKLNVDTL